MPLQQRELTPDRVTGGERITDFPARRYTRMRIDMAKMVMRLTRSLM